MNTCTGMTAAAAETYFIIAVVFFQFGVEQFHWMNTCTGMTAAAAETMTAVADAAVKRTAKRSSRFVFLFGAG